MITSRTCISDTWPLQQASQGAALAWALACAVPALLLVAPGALALTLHVVQKAGFLGAFGVTVVDAAVGAAIGAGVASLGGLLVPWLARVLRARLPVRGHRDMLAPGRQGYTPF